MSHFAKLDNNNLVIFVTVGRQEDDGLEAELCARTGDKYVQTSYNTSGGVHRLGGTPLRKNYAGIGYTYDEQRDAFIPPKPYASFILNEDTCLWEPPIIKPELTEAEVLAGSFYRWDEETLEWILETPEPLT